MRAKSLTVLFSGGNSRAFDRQAQLKAAMKAKLDSAIAIALLFWCLLNLSIL